jgi:hypothetical protein
MHAYAQRWERRAAIMWMRMALALGAKQMWVWMALALGTRRGCADAIVKCSLASEEPSLNGRMREWR